MASTTASQTTTAPSDDEAADFGRWLRLINHGD